MIEPFIPSRVIKPYNFGWIGYKRTNICSFAPIANSTGVSKVFRNCCSAMLDTNDMIDMKTKKSIIFVHKTILTSMECTFYNFLTEFSGDINTQDFSAFLARALASRIRCSSHIY